MLNIKSYLRKMETLQAHAFGRDTATEILGKNVAWSSVQAKQFVLAEDLASKKGL